VLPWIAIWSCFFLLWHVFVGKIALDVAIFAALGSLLATVAAWIVFREHLAPVRTGWRNLAQAVHIPKLIVTGTWEILAVLARHLFLGQRAPSLFFEVPFDTGGDDDESTFRRALAIAYATATPNFVVVDIDRERRVLVYHQIRKSDVPPMLKNLGARP
jgi:multisubunit Na+/H+ antiporter MnhE subunit